MRVSAVIVAAGKGVRAGDGPPKQYREVGGAAILARSMARFLDAPRVSDLCVAIRPEHRAFYDAATRALPALKPIRVVEGGAERADSVLRALEALAADPPDAVLIHDAARPFVSLRVIDAVIDALADATGA